MKPELKRTSKFLSLVLRHRPETIGLELSPDGWVEVDLLLEACRRHGRAISPGVLREVVTTNDKRRFSFSDDGLRIRANQGHSVDVDLGLEPVQPPELLYHGTVARFLDSIRRQGLIPGSRRHVHLSADCATAKNVGQRRGRPVILGVEAGRMHGDGHPFYLSENGVWLADAVPPQYLQIPEGRTAP